jgi:hypothetical protein
VRWKTGRLVALATAVLLVAGLVFAPTAAGAKSKRVTKKNACKILTKKDLEQIFGASATFQGQVAKKSDFLCKWQVDANGDRPAGPVQIVVSFDLAPGAYDALKNNAQYEVVDGLDADVLYQPRSATLSVFKGRRILGLSAARFFDTTVRPIRTYDPKLLLLVAAEKAIPRL